MVGGAIVLGIVGLVSTGSAVRLLLRVRRMSGVTGTVVARDSQFTGKGCWTYPVVEFALPDGSQIRRTFRQLARPAIGRKLRVVYDPSGPDGQKQAWGGLTVMSGEPMIYSGWLLLWLWVLAAAGLAFIAGCVFLPIAAG